MNQGNSGRFVGDDGVYQDGGLLVHFPDQQEWTAIFLKFQSQSWHTDDKTGHRSPRRTAGTAAARSAAAAPAAGTADRRGSRRSRPHRRRARQRDAVAGSRGRHAAEHRAARHRSCGMGAAGYPEEAPAAVGGAARRRDPAIQVSASRWPCPTREASSPWWTTRASRSTACRTPRSRRAIRGGRSCSDAYGSKRLVARDARIGDDHSTVNSNGPKNE